MEKHGNYRANCRLQIALLRAEWGYQRMWSVGGWQGNAPQCNQVNLLVDSNRCQQMDRWTDNWIPFTIPNSINLSLCYGWLAGNVQIIPKYKIITADVIITFNDKWSIYYCCGLALSFGDRWMFFRIRTLRHRTYIDLQWGRVFSLLSETERANKPSS